MKIFQLLAIRSYSLNSWYLFKQDVIVTVHACPWESSTITSTHADNLPSARSAQDVESRPTPIGIMID